MGKIGPKFSHLLTVRAEGADPPLTVSLTVKRPGFFMTSLSTLETLSTSLTYAESIWATLIHTEVSWRQGGRLTEGKGSRFLLTFTKSVEERSNESDVSLFTRSGKQPPHGGQEEQQTRWQVDWGQRDRSSLKGRVRPPTNRDTPATNSTWDEYKYARAQKKVQIQIQI